LGFEIGFEMAADVAQCRVVVFDPTDDHATFKTGDEVVGDISGVEISAGDKLGHSFFKLRDVDPSKEGVRRTVTGLGYSFSIPQRYLTPLLDSPKVLTTGEPKLV